MRSLRVRLFVAMLSALAMTLAVSISVGALLTRRQVDEGQSSALARRADDIAQQRRQRVSYIREDQQSGAVHILIQPRSQFTTFIRNVNRSSDGTTTYAGVRQLYSYRTLPGLGLLMLRPASVSFAAWRPFLVDLLIAALAGGAGAAALSFVIARSITNPLRRVAAATRALAAGESHEPLPTDGGLEVGGLAVAFNRMSEELLASREAERAFLLSVSHELKTPLTAIRGYAEGLSEGAFGAEEAADVIALEAGRLERLVRDLLDLARMNRSEFSVRSEPVDLAEVAHETVRRHEASARSFHVDLIPSVEEEAWVIADPDRVLQIASKLVENALRETPHGGRVWVTVARDGVLR
ncbi:MAG TPA: HAMP domain-containing sensor histidine kinase, partial [Gaiellaceae bacterium]|nr:HAMP domain-containing sensor histidine kinase [Gaiellaceae bacterium]